MKYSNGILTVTERCDKVRITHSTHSYTHNIGAANQLPLPFGDGTYTVEFLNKISGNKYRRLSTKTIQASGTDAYLLKSNAYVPETEAWAFAKDLCQGLNQMRSYKAVCAWVQDHILYDYIRAVRISKSTMSMPDPVTCWEKHTGICMDIASLTVGMLRAVGVPARMVIGKADRQNHAWVETFIGGGVFRFDHPTYANSYIRERWY